jgi:hypothetical protein
MKSAYSQAAALDRLRASRTSRLAAASPGAEAPVGVASSRWPILVVLALAAVLQVNSTTPSDVSWLITLCEKMLGGERPYVDFIESNPPAAFFIYFPATLIARAVGMRPEMTVGLFGFATLLASLAICAVILVRAGLASGVENFRLLVAVAVLALLPGHVFDQREYIALLVGLPLFVVLAVRASGTPVALAFRVLSGLGAAVTVAIKPYFALTILAVLPYFVSRVGVKAFLRSIELHAAAAFGVLYVAIVVFCFPAFLAQVAPVAAAVYAPLREPWSVLALNAGVIAWASLGLYLCVGAPRRLGEPLVAIPALASLGAMAGFLVQGKGWPYQAYPAVALMALAFGLAAAHERSDERSVALAILLSVPAVAAVSLAPGLIGLLFILTAASGAAFLAAAILAERDATRRVLATRTAVLAFASVFSLAGLFFLRQSDDLRSLEAKVAAVAPHPSIVALSQDIALGFPLTRDVQGTWAQRPNSLWVTHDAMRLIKASGDDPATIERFAPYLRLDRDMLVEDIEHNRPDVVLIDNRARSFHDWAFADPLLAAALAPYRLFATDRGAHGDIEVYARADHLGDSR